MENPIEKHLPEIIGTWLNEHYVFADPDNVYLSIAAEDPDRVVLCLEYTRAVPKDDITRACQMEILAFEGSNAVIVRTLDENGEMPRIDLSKPDSFEEIAKHLEPFFCLYNGKRR
jgi:hypothetical protein